MLILIIIILIIFIVISFLYKKLLLNNIKLLQKQLKENQNKQKTLNKQCENIKNNIIEKQKIENDLSISINNKLTEINHIDNILLNKQNNEQQAFDNYCNILKEQYINKEEEYNDLVKNLEDSYYFYQQDLYQEADKVKNELNTLKSTRAAAIQAQLKEEEIKQQTNFYCLIPTQEEIDDIEALERVKVKLHQPRILCMLIWSTYFQKPMTSLCNRILGTDKIVCGIYKITNQKTNECYIGQAVDIAKRLKDHAKCGLGIDTPINNKLYKAIQEYGIWNFSWELLEQCVAADLNEKENFYIELYQSKNFGYNSSIGIKKK